VYENSLNRVVIIGDSQMEPFCGVQEYWGSFYPFRPPFRRRHGATLCRRSAYDHHLKQDARQRGETSFLRAIDPWGSARGRNEYLCSQTLMPDGLRDCDNPAGSD